MKDLRGQARVTTFLRKSLAEGAQDVRKLEAMARKEGLLGERHRITHAKAFKRAKHSLRIKSVRAGFGPSGGWRWELPCDRASSIINSRGVDCRNFLSFEVEIAGGFKYALKIDEMSGVF